MSVPKLTDATTIFDGDQHQRPKDGLETEDQNLTTNAWLVQCAPRSVQGETRFDVSIEYGNALSILVQLTVVKSVFQVHRRKERSENPSNDRHDLICVTRAVRRGIIACEDSEGIDHGIDHIGDHVDDEEIGKSNDGCARA